MPVQFRCLRVNARLFGANTVRRNLRGVLSLMLAKDEHNQDAGVARHQRTVSTPRWNYTLSILLMYTEHFAKQAEPLDTTFSHLKCLISRPRGTVPRSLNHHLLPLSMSGSSIQGADRQMTPEGASVC